MFTSDHLSPTILPLTHMDPLGVQAAEPRRAGMLETADRLEARPDKVETGVIGGPDRGGQSTVRTGSHAGARGLERNPHPHSHCYTRFPFLSLLSASLLGRVKTLNNPRVRAENQRDHPPGLLTRGLDENRFDKPLVFCYCTLSFNLPSGTYH